MKVCFNGFQENATSFEVSGTVSPGDPVKISGNGTVAASADTEAFCGVALGVRDGIAVVQLGGYVKVPYTGSVSTGFQKLSAAGEGKVKADENGREFLVIDVDSTAQNCGLLL